jgi:MFS family permease
LTADALPAASPLRHRPFLFYWLLAGCASTASQIMGVALGWQVYALTRDPLDLGLIGLAQFLPAFLLALPAGHAVDRFRRRTILRACLAVDAAVGLGLAIGSASETITVEAVFALAALLGAARAFEWPAGSALLAGLVPRENLGRAVALTSSMRQVASILGPALGGAIYALGPAGCYAACTAAWGTGLALALSLPAGAAAPPREKATLGSILAGIRFIRERPEILGSISLDLFAVLLGGATALLPIYARDILRTGPVGLGILRSGPAIGALVVAGILARWPLQRRNGAWMLSGVALFGIATCVFAVSSSFPLSLAALVVLGASDMISVFVRLTLVQLRTPDEMRGRVSAVNGIFIGTSNQLGEFESGLTASWFGTVPATLLGGIGTLVVVAAWALAFPGLRRIDRLEDGR